MGVIIKQHELQPHKGITTLSIVGMVVAFSAATVNTIWALYLDSFFNSEVAVGFFSAFLTIVAFASYFFFIPIIEKRDKAKIYAFSLILFIIFFLLFSINLSVILMSILAIAMTVLSSLRITSYGILVKDNSSNKELSKNEGIVFTLLNLAFVVGPLLAGFVAASLGISFVFILAAAFTLIGFIIFKATHITGEEGKKRVDHGVFRNFKDFFRSKDRLIAYFIGSGIQLWWILIYLFVPLQMNRQGLSELMIGFFLFAVAVPLIILEYVFSKKAGKIGFKKIFKIGYLTVAVISILTFFLSANIYVMLSLLVLASVGMAMLEPTTQAYFFDILKGKEEYRFYGPYNTAIDTGNFIGKIFGSVLLILLPFKFIFILFGVFMFLLFLLSYKAKGVLESRRKL